MILLTQRPEKLEISCLDLLHIGSLDTIRHRICCTIFEWPCRGFRPRDAQQLATRAPQALMAAKGARVRAREQGMWAACPTLSAAAMHMACY